MRLRITETMRGVHHFVDPELGEATDQPFYFKIDCDSLNDFGKVELSMDNGNTWYDVLTLDTLVNMITWLEPKPILTGAMTTWNHFSVDLMGITYQFGMTDTLLYKFTFISDLIR